MKVQKKFLYGLSALVAKSLNNYYNYNNDNKIIIHNYITGIRASRLYKQMVKDCIQYSGSDVLARQCWHQREVTAKACAQIFLGYFNLVHFVKAMNIIESGCCDVSIRLKHTHQILFTQLPKLQKLLRHQKLGAAYRAPYFPKD